MDRVKIKSAGDLKGNMIFFHEQYPNGVVFEIYGRECWVSTARDAESKKLGYATIEVGKQNPDDANIFMGNNDLVAYIMSKYSLR